ncbi:hypothetical protein SAMN02745166_00734 [Prosthecobacter debontii]|uniref:Uncharacterized protein n=1 Tax=Prosthecobacter debontii TaxID=48467 RepID=A0A1T4WX64_9BACT|nr:hypothetical protein SAMN02745166_00734 [Prosthecobacter debontii]
MPIPSISKSRPMKYEASFFHELSDLLSCSWFAKENGLTGDHADIPFKTVNAVNPPIETEKIHGKSDSLQILLQSRKSIRTKQPPILSWMSRFDSAPIFRKPNLMFGAPGLSKTCWKLDLIHDRDFQSLFQIGRLVLVSRPTFSKSFTWASHASRVTGGCSRTMRAKRSRSA